MRVICVVCALCAACGGGSTGPTADAPGGGEGVASASGAFEGASFSGITHALSEVASTSKGSSLEVVLTQGATCGNVTAGPAAGSVVVDLVLYSIAAGTGSSAAPTGAGTFSLDTTSAGPYAEADVVAFDATCTPTTSGKFTTGTVMLKSVTDDEANGSFTLGGGSDSATGMFSSALCVGAGELVDPPSGAACH
jgi:hypothetical protein